MPAQPLPLLCLLFFFFFSTVIISSPKGAAIIVATPPLTPPSSALLLNDAVSILSFKSQADLDNKLLYTLHERFDYCSWQGVKCVQGRVVRFFLPAFGLRGQFPPDSLSRLDQLRVLSLKNNSLTGPIPDLSRLINLETLILDLNSFSGSFPLSILPLHTLHILDLSSNNLTGLLPSGLTGLVLLKFLRVDSNGFNGSIPPLNQSGLVVFNVSGNNLTGPVPVTPTLRKFTAASFLGNPELCGEVINKPCRASHFFDSPSSAAAAAASPPTPLFQSAQSQGEMIHSPSSHKKRKNIGVVLCFVIGVFLIVAAVLCIFAIYKKRKEQIDDAKTIVPPHENDDPDNHYSKPGRLSDSEMNNSVLQVQQDSSRNYKKAMKGGNLVFCNGEAELYGLEVLMRASAELLGRGTFGTTYKAVLQNELIVTVKRLDSSKTGNTSGEVFEQHMEAVGVLRHPNLVPVRAYFQAKQEKLIVYDYQPSGSLFNLIHGSRSTRAKPLHWTSCLKIAEDVAQGLAYIHQASNLIHGNLKSTNVLLGADFEACLTDYCLIVFADISYSDDPESLRYKAPEIQRLERHPTSKADVYAFGVLLLELLTGKPSSQHPFLAAPDMPDWVRAMREDDIEEEKWVAMLVEIASLCSVISPEQRPTMRQALKMIENIKDCAMVEDSIRDAYKGQ